MYCREYNLCMQAPRICDYQTATYMLTIEDITDPSVELEPIQSTYTGSNGNVMEVVMLTIDHNYTLFISVVENHFEIQVSKSKNFSTFFCTNSWFLFFPTRWRILHLYNNIIVAHIYIITNIHTYTHTCAHACTYTHTNTHTCTQQTAATLFRSGASGTSSGMSRK
jgi:hypothetical protein